jgi:hypothetical protein
MGAPKPEIFGRQICPQRRALLLGKMAASASPAAGTGAIGVGLVGLGWSVRIQVPMLRSAGFFVAGLCGRQPDDTAKAA